MSELLKNLWRWGQICETKMYSIFLHPIIFTVICALACFPHLAPWTDNSTARSITHPGRSVLHDLQRVPPVYLMQLVKSTVSAFLVLTPSGWPLQLIAYSADILSKQLFSVKYGKDLLDGLEPSRNESHATCGSLVKDV